MSQYDRMNLVEFLNQLDRLLAGLVEGGDQFFPDIQSQVRQAWKEVGPLIEQIIGILGNPESFPGPGSLDERLAAAGLTGAQLALKLAAFQAARRELDALLGDLKADLSTLNILDLGRKNLRKLRRLLKLINRLLAYANIILGSLAQLIPISEPVKEFKDVLKEGVDDVLDKYPEQPDSDQLD